MENNINLPPFYVGQRVVAIKDHSQGFFKKGQEFKVTGMYPYICKCKSGWTITVGQVHFSPLHEPCCGICKTRFERKGQRQFETIAFAPIEEQEFKAVTFKKIMEEIPICAQ